MLLWVWFPTPLPLLSSSSVICKLSRDKNKTSALIECAIYLGAVAAEADEKEIDNLIAFGKNIGLAFQVVDDILDITSSSEVLGKNVKKDMESNKATYPAVYSLEGAKAKADEYIEKAMAHLDIFKERADILRDIAKFITERNS